MLIPRSICRWHHIFQLLLCQGKWSVLCSILSSSVTGCPFLDQIDNPFLQLLQFVKFLWKVNGQNCTYGYGWNFASTAYLCWKYDGNYRRKFPSTVIFPLEIQYATGLCLHFLWKMNFSWFCELFLYCNRQRYTGLSFFSIIPPGFFSRNSCD